MFFFLNATATTEIYTFPLHDALPIRMEPHEPAKRRAIHQAGHPETAKAGRAHGDGSADSSDCAARRRAVVLRCADAFRSEEHTSELQSRPHIVCRLLLEKNTAITVEL